MSNFCPRDRLKLGTHKNNLWVTQGNHGTMCWKDGRKATTQMGIASQCAEQYAISTSSTEFCIFVMYMLTIA